MPVKQRLAAYYRAAAARGRGLLARATTPWVREQLGAEIAQCDRMVEEIEGAAEPTPTDPRHAVSASDVDQIKVADAHQHLAPLGVNRTSMVSCAIP